MKLFGGYLPLIGFRDHLVDDDLRAQYDLPTWMTTITYFEVEWLHNGVAIAVIPLEKE